MSTSLFELFSIGIGPSSSHTVGPMRAANRFVTSLSRSGEIFQVSHLKTELFGSLGATGWGHGSVAAVVLGLAGDAPENVPTQLTGQRMAEIESTQKLLLNHEHLVTYSVKDDVILHRKLSLPFHPNGMTFTATLNDGTVRTKTYFSIGGGFVVAEDSEGNPVVMPDRTIVPFPFRTGAELLDHCLRTGKSIAEIAYANECSRRPEVEVRAGILHIWQVMDDCIQRGQTTTGVLPGGLKVQRRAADTRDQLLRVDQTDPLTALDWVTTWALAVNEENASGGRIVTAPTNGAAGIIPATCKYAVEYLSVGQDKEQLIIEFLLTAAAIGAIYQQTASISGAEVGCQGEVGTACSMAAAALTQVQGGGAKLVEIAAEIGMEHHLGLTCDPVGGLVQIPCIERNAIGSIKAITAARLALRRVEEPKVSLDKVIKTMMETGADMKRKYKETSRGGLAVNIVEC